MTKEAVLNNINFKELSKSCKTQDDIASLTKEFMKNMIENMLKAEIDEFVENNDTSKNGYYPKKVRRDSGELELNIPRDRSSEFEPQIVKKGQRTISGIVLT